MTTMTIHGITVTAEMRLLNSIKNLPYEKAVKSLRKLQAQFTRNRQTEEVLRQIGPRRNAGSQLAGWISPSTPYIPEHAPEHRLVRKGHEIKAINGNPLIHSI